MNVILHTYIDYQSKSCIYLVRIFIENSLKVVRTQKTCLELKTTLYEVVWSLFVNELHVTCLTEEIDHISYVVDSGRESLRIQIENMSYERLFFGQGQIILDVTIFGLRDTVLYLITKSGLRDVVRLYSISNRHFLIRTNSLNDKKNSNFLRLRVYYVVVLWLYTIVRRL